MNTKRIYRIVLCLLAMVVALAQTPLFDLMAEAVEDSSSIEINLKQVDGQGARLDVRSKEQGTATIMMEYEGASETRSVMANQSIEFLAKNNGSYRFYVQDAKGLVLSERGYEVSTIEDLYVLYGGEHKVNLIVRDSKAAALEVSLGQEKERVTLTERESVKEGSFTMKRNGEYWFRGIEEGGSYSGSKASYIEASYEEEEKVIAIERVEDLQEIVKNPKGSYELKRDIVVESNPLEDITFTGTLKGNGYVIEGLKGPLFSRIEGAVIENVHLVSQIESKEDTAGLTKEAIDSTFSGVSVSGRIVTESRAAGLLLTAKNIRIVDSYVNVEIAAKSEAAGLVLSGQGEIEGSYGVGVLKADNVYGLTRECTVKNSYSAMGLSGKKRVLLSEGVKENCFYDILLNDMEDREVTGYTTRQIISGTLESGFVEIEGSYPRAKGYKSYGTRAKELSDLSALALEDRGNLGSIEGKITLDSKEKWSEEGNEVEVETGKYPDKGESKVIQATRKNDAKSFLLKGASLQADNEVKAGKSNAASSTEISFNISHNGNDVTDITYYKVVEGSEVPVLPASHEEAINTGWRAAYWSGVYNWNGLHWNREYHVYSTKLSSIEEIGSVTTAKGKIGGNIILEGSYETGATMKAAIQDTYTTKGYYVWLSSESRTGAYSEITRSEVKEGVLEHSYTVTGNEIGKYLRVQFVSEDADYIGRLERTTENLLRTGIESVHIEATKQQVTGQYTIEDVLSAKMEPVKYKDEVIYQWYREGEEKEVHTGTNYTLTGADVGKQIYAKAIAKEGGHLSGSKESARTSEVQPLTHLVLSQAPEIAMNGNVEKIEDRSITVRMPMPIEGDSTGKGLYQFGYTTGGSDPIHTFPVIARGSSEVTITGLEANKIYYIYVKRIGENGYLDSPEWSTGFVEAETAKEYVTGQIELREKNGSSPMEVYGNTLVAKVTGVTNPSQTGQYTFYYVREDGSRGDIIRSSEIGAQNFELKLDSSHYIGKKIEVEYVGKNDYSGSIRYRSEMIEKKTIHAPYDALKQKTGTTVSDTSIEVVLPKKDGDIETNETFIIGYSSTKEGVPVEYRENGQVVKFAPSTDTETTALLKNLTRDTKYYFFLRYSEHDTHVKSDWQTSDKALGIQTDQTALTGSVVFGYANVEGKAIQGDRIEANLSGVNNTFTYKGEWKWIKKYNGTDTPIHNFFMIRDEDGSNVGTYYRIPEDEEIGAIYEVTFTPSGGFKNPKQSTSVAVEKKEKGKYDAPSAPEIVSGGTEDTSVTVKQGSGEGIYQFGYALSTTPNDIKEYSLTAYSGVEVKVTGLDRNRNYVFYSRRTGDSEYETSDWSNTGIAETTKRTDISGYIEIESIPTSGVELEAKYISASYEPSGLDNKGTWKWYRNNVLIANATGSRYTPTSEDVGKKLQVEYYGEEDFQGKVSYESEEVGKEIPADPVIQSVGIGTETETGDLTIEAVTETNIYYRLQKAGVSVPNRPGNDTELAEGKWMQSTTGIMLLSTDYQGEKLEPNTGYILYIVKKGTGTVQASNVIASEEVKLKQKVQRGSMTITGKSIINESIVAKVEGGNNEKGTWKWYASKEDCGDGTKAKPDVKDAGKWQEIASGYSPTVDSTTSTLTISEGLWKKYIKAEFVANEELGYTGKVIGSHASYVRKVYDETITLSTTHTDGNGKMAAYSGTKLTGTVDNYIESGNLDRATVQFKVGNTVLTPTKSGNTFTYDMPNEAGYNGLEIVAEVSTPRNYRWYVDSEKKELTSKVMVSKTSTNTSCIYKNGIPISNGNDLRDFMKQEGNYTNRSSDALYIITNNINMMNIPEVTNVELRNCGVFAGTLDGDYHTITHLKNYMIFIIRGESPTNRAVVKNMIINDVNFDLSTVISSVGIIAIMGYNIDFNNLFLTQAKVATAIQCGFLMAKSDNANSNGAIINVNGCSTAGGEIKASEGGAGFIGMIQNNHTLNLKNCSSYKTTIEAVKYPIAANNPLMVSGGFVGKNGANAKINSKNVVVASIFGGNLSSNSGGVSFISGNATAGLDTGAESSFYDATISPQTVLNNHPSKGTAKSTIDMIGEGLKPNFGSDESWTYTEGYYPRLNWIAAHPVAGLYAATRGAFVSLDGKTNSTNMFNGNIYGTIQVPTELQGRAYSVKSSDTSVLNVVGNTLVPLKKGTATITITYTEPDASIGGSASNTYTFNVQQVASNANVTVSGIANPGKVLSATAGATSYQWIRRKNGSTTREVISGATQSSYTIKATDIGYEMAVEAVYGTAKVASGYTSAVTSVAPASAPALSNITDTSLDAKVNGVEGMSYEYAYASTSNGAKTIMGSSTGVYTFKGLKRNTEYYIYARAKGGEGYEPSGWSPAAKVRTQKTAMIGPLKLSEATSMGDTLSASMPDTNGQTGTWKIERIDSSGTEILTPDSSSGYGMTYTLTKSDVGSVIKVSFIASGDFRDFDSGVLSTSTEVILRQRQNAVGSVEEVSEKRTDHSLTVKQSQSGDSYDIAYRKDGKGEYVTVRENVSTNEEVTIENLTRNSVYYVYARRHEKEDYESGPWSAALVIRTKGTELEGELSAGGTARAKETITFSAPDTNGQTGKWRLERVSSKGSVTIHSSKYTVSEDGRTLSYEVKAEDAGNGTIENRMKATYTGSGDFQGSKSVESAVIDRASQTLPNEAEAGLTSAGEYSLNIEVTKGKDIYQLGYSSDGGVKITPYAATISVGTTVAMEGLERDTGYQVYIRKAEKTGYYASEWQEIAGGKEVFHTTKTPINGNITYSEIPAIGGSVSPSGMAAIGNTLTASYENGKYRENEDANVDGNGTWQWYRGEVAIEGATSVEYTVEPTEGTPEISVQYTANSEDGFSESITRVIGNVYKTPYEVPKPPVVEAASENGEIGNGLKITHQVDSLESLYYYIQKSSNDALPALISASEAETAGSIAVSGTANSERWLKVIGTDMTVNLEANESYVVYAARLETERRGASGIVSARSVKTSRESVTTTSIEEVQIEGKDVRWKVMQEKTLKVSLHDGQTGPTGSWRYYVTTQEPPINGMTDRRSWQSIDDELSERSDSRTEREAVSTFTIPLKYADYYLRAEFSGSGDYSDTITLLSPKLEGQLLSGQARVVSDNIDTSKVYNPIVVHYDGNDDENGQWRWYRQKEGAGPDSMDKSDYELILNGNGRPYGTIGVDDSYMPTAKDIGKRIYAEYTASVGSQYSGSVETARTMNTEKLEQNTPSAPVLLQVNGNDVQFSFPDNYKTPAEEIPSVVLGYIEATANEDGSYSPKGEITWQSESERGNIWLKGLKKSSDYLFYARFEGTKAYQPSLPSIGVHGRTGEERFEEDKLSVQAITPVAGSGDTALNSDSGNLVTFIYSGRGYEEGEYILTRSNGDVIDTAKYTTVIEGSTAKCEYTQESGDIGTRIVATFQAKADAIHYGGSIEKATDYTVTKPAAIEKAIMPELLEDLDTNLLIEVKDEYEYVLMKHTAESPGNTAPGSASGKWQKLRASTTREIEGAVKPLYEYRGLERGATYYLHVRVAETAANRASEALTSEGKTLAYIDLGRVTVQNSKDSGMQPSVIETPVGRVKAIEIPTTLKKGTVEIAELKMYREDTESVYSVANPNTSIYEFKDNRNIYEKGSDWSNSHYGVNVQIEDGNGEVISQSEGNGTSIDTSGGKNIIVEIYRANAVSEGGIYTIDILLKDSTGQTALLRAKAEIVTQIENQINIKGIQLHVSGRYIRQSTNTTKMINNALMPLSYRIDRKAVKGYEDVPELQGKLTKDAMEVGNGEVYLKISGDGSSYTVRDRGVWLETGSESKEEGLYVLGSRGKGSYAISGVCDPYIDWKFNDTGVRERAYGIKTIVEIEKEDREAYSQK